MVFIKVFYYFNVFFELSEKVLEEVFINMGVECFEKIKQFFVISVRSFFGLVQFKDIEEVVNVLVLVNYVLIFNSFGKSFYVMKLCFLGSLIGGRQKGIYQVLK